MIYASASPVGLSSPILRNNGSKVAADLRAADRTPQTNRARRSRSTLDSTAILA
jgi:hypothetical protein